MVAMEYMVDCSAPGTLKPASRAHSGVAILLGAQAYCISAISIKRATLDVVTQDPAVLWRRYFFEFEPPGAA